MEKIGVEMVSRRAIFIILFLLFSAFGLFILQTDQLTAFRMLTRWHSSAGNIFFRGVTFLGDGLFIIGLAIVFIFLKKYQWATGVIVGYLLSGLFAQLVKKIFNRPRPKAVFEAIGQKVYEVPGVDVHLHGSFPSGHTASAFALAIFMLLVLPYRWYSWLLMVGVCGVGYSRMYLSQHFPEDVWAGAIIGTLSGLLVAGWLNRYQQKHPNSKWMR
jgi:membrane-associated phospholipid phosphatase